MESPIRVFTSQEIIGEMTPELREIVKSDFITYGFIVN